MEERDLKSLTAEAGKGEERDLKKGTKQADTQPTKRTSYNRLLQKSTAHAARPVSQTPKSVSVSKGLHQSRLASQQLTPSPKKEIKERSCASVPRLDTKKSTTEVLEEVAMKGDFLRAQDNVKTVREVMDALATRDDDPTVSYLLDFGKRVIESGGNQHDFDLFSDSLLQSALPLDPPIRSKLSPSVSSPPISLADSKRQAASLKDQMDTCISSLSPFFFADLKGKSAPIPDAELVAYCFLSLLRIRDEDLDVPDGFKVMHHRTWKSIQAHAAHPGKIVQAVKTLPQAIKHGKLTSASFAAVQLLLAPIACDKIASDEMAVTMLRYMETAIAYAKSCEVEREKETSTLQFMKLRDASPRRKLLTSLLNRSTEESREEEPPVFRDSIRLEKAVPEPCSEDLEESKAVELPLPTTITLTEVAFPTAQLRPSDILSEPQPQSNRTSEAPAKADPKDSPSKPKPAASTRPNTTPVKPSPRKLSQEGVKSPQKSPFKSKAVSKPEPAVKPVTSSAKKRPVLKPKPEPEVVVETPDKMRMALLLDVKLRVFLQEKVLNAKLFPEPISEEDAARLMEVFAKDLEHCGENIEGVNIGAYTGRMTLAVVTALLTSVKSRQAEAQQSPDSWTHREIQRQKDRMSQTLTRLQMRKSLS